VYVFVTVGELTSWTLRRNWVGAQRGVAGPGRRAQWSGQKGKGAAEKCSSPDPCFSGRGPACLVEISPGRAQCGS